MKRIKFIRPTAHYDEEIKQIDEKICELIKQRKEVSNNNPGYPPFEYIYEWAGKFGLYEEQLKSIFGSLMNEKVFKPLVEPEGFRMNLPVLKSVEKDDRLFSVVSIRQYLNSSVVNFNIDWDSTGDSPECQPRHTHFELYIDEQHDCRMADGTGGSGHFHFNFVVSPPLPDNLSGTELIFKEYNPPFGAEQTGRDIVIML